MNTWCLQSWIIRICLDLVGYKSFSLIGRSSFHILIKSFINSGSLEFSYRLSQKLLRSVVCRPYQTSVWTYLISIRYEIHGLILSFAKLTFSPVIRQRLIMVIWFHISLNSPHSVQLNPRVLVLYDLIEMFLILRMPIFHVFSLMRVYFGWAICV